MLTALPAALILALLAMLHFVWATGSTWPAENDTKLARMVAGFRGVTEMPPRLASLTVALILLASAVITLMSAGPAPHSLIRLTLIAITAVFALRGIAAWLPVWRRLTPEQPFATLDRRYYGPLCLLISALCAATLLAAP